MSGMTGRSRKPPKGDVRPLGTPPLKVRKTPEPKVPAFVKTAAYASLPEPEQTVQVDSTVPIKTVVSACFKGFIRVETIDPDGQIVDHRTIVLDDTQKVVDTTVAGEVSLHQSPVTTTDSQPHSRSRTMTLTLKGLSKNRKNAFYSGTAAQLRFPLSAFFNRTAPQTIEVEGDFAEPKAAKVKLSAEERKAVRASKPKPTLAEKIAQREAALAKLKTQAAEEASL